MAAEGSHPSLNGMQCTPFQDITFVIVSPPRRTQENRKWRSSSPGRRPPKIGFWAKDIGAARQELLGRGAKMSKLMVGAGLIRCEGKDPDGNPFSISDRR